MADSAILLDTNILLSATAPARALHANASLALNKWPNYGVPICTSGQILREYLVVATRSHEVNGLGLSLSEALSNRDALRERMTFLDETYIVADRLRQLVESAECMGKQMHDANVVATALVHGVDRILTENTVHYERFAGVIEIVDLRRIS